MWGHMGKPKKMRHESNFQFCQIVFFRNRTSLKLMRMSVTKKRSMLGKQVEVIKTKFKPGPHEPYRLGTLPTKLLQRDPN